jgi:hypothetical protein
MTPPGLYFPMTCAGVLTPYSRWLAAAALSVTVLASWP